MPRSHLLPFAAGVLAIGIFVFDTLSPLQFAVAVLYVVVVLVAATHCRRPGVLLAAVACAALTILSFLLEHGLRLEGAAALRCAVSLAAIAITTFLALRSLAAIERLRATEQQRANLARFFSPRLVDQLVGIDTPLSVARYQPAAVMFVDMVEFTSHSAGMAPAAVIALLRELSALLSEAVFAHDGSIDKFLGDGLMAVFGPPMPSPCDATNAARCALHIQHSVDAWNERRLRRGDAPVRVAVGIHHGDVVQADIGSDRRLELTVLGNPVNIASRIEAYCRTLDAAVLVSDAFIAALHAEDGNRLAERFSDQGRHTLRGHTEPIRLYGIRRSAQASDRSRSGPDASAGPGHCVPGPTRAAAATATRDIMYLPSGSNPFGQ